MIIDNVISDAEQNEFLELIRTNEEPNPAFMGHNGLYHNVAKDSFLTQDDEEKPDEYSK